MNKIKIGNKFDYVENDLNERNPVIITNIIFDGFIFLIEFKYENKNEIGVSAYPDKFK